MKDLCVSEENAPNAGSKSPTRTKFLFGVHSELRVFAGNALGSLACKRAVFRRRHNEGKSESLPVGSSQHSSIRSGQGHRLTIDDKEGA